MEHFDAELASLFKYPIKQRNQVIDAAFYDVDALSSGEKSQLSPFFDREGSVLVVPPRAANRRLRHYHNALQFVVTEGDAIQALVVAGVGSSVLGTAALARNVADHYGMDVAGVVSGYGVADVIAEGLGGWCFYGIADQFWTEVESLARKLMTIWEQTRSRPSPQTAERAVDSRFVTPGSTDIGTLYDILVAQQRMRLLVGHSKGNLLISLALRHFARELGSRSHPYFDDLTIVTLGAVVGIPKQFTRTHQFLGSHDLLGRLNSQLDIPHQRVDGAGHHLNPNIRGHMSVDEVLQSLPLRWQSAVREPASV